MSSVELSHEVNEKFDSYKRHSVVHGNSNTWVESVSPNLDDSDLLGLCHEELLKIFVATSDSENDVDSGSVS